MKMQTTRGRGEKEGGKGGWRLFNGAVFMQFFFKLCKENAFIEILLGIVGTYLRYRAVPYAV